MSEFVTRELTVNRVCLSLLVQELVPTAIRVTHARQESNTLDNADPQTRIDTLLSTPDDLPGTSVIFRSDLLMSDDTIYRVETYGYSLGMRLAEYIMYSLRSEIKLVVVLDVMKFICRELWKELYGKQMDSLRTNHRGTFVLIDTNFKSIANLSSPDSISELMSAAKVYLLFPCGIIRGVLTSFGIDAYASADIKLFPSVEFSIQTSEGV